MSSGPPQGPADEKFQQKSHASEVRLKDNSFLKESWQVWIQRLQPAKALPLCWGTKSLIRSP